MDRCRCADYKKAVDDLRLYTVGTMRPEILDLYDRTGIDCGWVDNKIDLIADLRMEKPVACKTLTPEEKQQHQKFLENKNFEQMLCSYMKRPLTSRQVPKGWPNWEYWMQE